MQNNKQKTRFTTCRTTCRTTNKKNDLQEAERHVGHRLKNIRRKKKYLLSKQRAREREKKAEKTSEKKNEESRQLLNNLDTKEKEKEKSCAKKEKEKEMEAPEVLRYDELKQVNADRIGQMMGNLNWLRDMMISNNRTMEQMKGYLHRFGEHCNAGNTTLTTRDMYSYFRNWLRYQLKEEEQKKRMERKQQSQPSGQKVSKANQFRLSEINAAWDDFKMPELTEEDKKLLEYLNRPR